MGFRNGIIYQTGANDRSTLYREQEEDDFSKTDTEKERVSCWEHPEEFSWERHTNGHVVQFFKCFLLKNIILVSTMKNNL